MGVELWGPQGPGYRKMKRAVTLVRNEENPSVACAGEEVLFDLVNFESKNADYFDKLKASAICASCPMTAKCPAKIRVPHPTRVRKRKVVQPAQAA